MFSARSILPVALLCGSLLVGCSVSSHSYLVSGLGREKGVVDQMFRGLDEHGNDAQARFLYMQEIIRALRAKHNLTKLNLFLTDYVARHRKDVYDSYYLYVVARNYREQQAVPFAVHYYDRILENYPDLLVHGRSIHYESLSALIKLVKSPERRVAYYKELISRFGSKIETGTTYYRLAQTYAALGEWDLEMQAYKSFLSSRTLDVPGVPGARGKARYLITLYEYPHKDWAMASLDKLVAAVRYAIYTRNTRLLARYRSKVGFFARSWESESIPLDPAFLSDFDVFMNPSVYASRTLDIDSNAQEAYLRTGGWSYRIETWYLYFRKINFPQDPNIQGKWEWAGIYFGEKPFSGASGT